MLKSSVNIAAQRITAIDGIHQNLRALHEHYQIEKNVCTCDVAASEQCGAMLIGALRRTLRNRFSVSRQDKAPYSGSAFTKMRLTLRNIKGPIWYHSKYGHRQLCALRLGIFNRVKARVADV